MIALIINPITEAVAALLLLVPAINGLRLVRKARRHSAHAEELTDKCGELEAELECKERPTQELIDTRASRDIEEGTANALIQISSLLSVKVMKVLGLGFALQIFILGAKIYQYYCLS